MFDSYTKLLLHFENNVTDIATGKIVTNTNVTFDNTDPKFNSYGVFNGTSSYLSIPDSDDFYFGTGNFTIDFWVKFTTLTTNYTFMHQIGAVGSYWELSKGAPLQGNKLAIRFKVEGNDKADYKLDDVWSGVTTGVWYHLCFERVGTTAKIFIDGVSQILTETVAFGTNDVGNINAALNIGLNYSASKLNGNLDELRISKGITRWTENFTPPTHPYRQTKNILPTFYRS